MVEFTHIITDPEGLHARPVVDIVATLKSFTCQATVSCGTRTTDARDLMGLMALNARKGDELVVQLDGADEEAAAEALRSVLP